MDQNVRNFISVEFLIVLSVDLTYHHRSKTLNSEAVEAHRPFWTIQHHPTQKKLMDDSGLSVSRP